VGISLNPEGRKAERGAGEKEWVNTSRPTSGKRTSIFLVEKKEKGGEVLMGREKEGEN